MFKVGLLWVAYSSFFCSMLQSLIVIINSLSVGLFRLLTLNVFIDLSWLKFVTLSSVFYLPICFLFSFPFIFHLLVDHFL